jgi:GMP synthase (glutamine-hydrolysing)
MSSCKKILLFNAVEWAPVYPLDHPLRNVPRWYQRHFDSNPNVEWLVRGYGELPVSDAISAADGVIMTGSPRDAWTDDPVNELMCDVVRSCLDSSKPFLGVCYGHQILGRTLGAKVGRHPAGLQLGPVLMNLSDEGKQDALFDGTGDSFEALSGHADYVAEVPKETVLLASGGVTTVQGIRWGERIYGVQFHPEMNADILQFLWQARITDWKGNASFDLAQQVAAIHDTPVGTKVLKNFVEKIV